MFRNSLSYEESECSFLDLDNDFCNGIDIQGGCSFIVCILIHFSFNSQELVIQGSCISTGAGFPETRAVS